jgi:hypothetical protein
VWVIFGVGVGVVQAVHYAIGPRAQKGRTLENEGEDIKNSLPGLAHGKHLMGCIAVQKEGLGK